jgi:DNA-binding response OmpR family regulator
MLNALALKPVNCFRYNPLASQQTKCKMESLPEKYRKSLAEKIAALTLLSRDWRPGDQQTRSKICSLSQSLTTFGTSFHFPTISETARLVEHAGDPELLASLAKLLSVLKTTITQSNDANSTEQESLAILVIDDDTELSSALQHSFLQKNPHYRIHVAASAHAAADCLTTNRYSMILLELLLPDHDGRELLRTIRYQLNVATPVYMLSTVDKEEIRHECMQLGADKYINKPIEPDALVSAIDKFLHQPIKHGLHLPPVGFDQQTGEDSRTTTPRTPATAIKILLAEEDKQCIELVTKRLAKEKFSLTLAPPGPAALLLVTELLLAQQAPTLCIINAHMAQLDGFELLRHIRSSSKNQSLPVLMLTGTGSKQDISRALHLGADDYLINPFTAIQLAARVKSLLKKVGIVAGIKK